MAAVMMVGVDERVVLGDALCFAEVRAGVGPFLTQVPVEPFDLTVGLGPVWAGAFGLMEPSVSAKRFDLYGDPSSVRTRKTVMPQLLT